MNHKFYSPQDIRVSNFVEVINVNVRLVNISSIGLYSLAYGAIST